MKHILLITAALFSFSNALYSQEIPNGNLEEWEWIGGWFEQPTFWQTSNSQIITHTEKDSLACQEDYAIKVSPFPGIETSIGIVNTSFPTTYIPATFNFCAKTFLDNTEGFTDTCRVKLQFWNEDVLVQETVWTNTESLDEWTQITLALEQIEPIITQCAIQVEASYPGIGLGSGSINTWISVDDFSFEFIDSIPKPAATDFSIHPNPSSQKPVIISSDGPLRTLLVYDLLGNLVFRDFSMQSEKTLEVILSSGIYLVQVGDKKKRLVIN